MCVIELMWLAANNYCPVIVVTFDVVQHFKSPKGWLVKLHSIVCIVSVKSKL
jgi:hypothetical protein|tara:strand:- start:455 stop:610 length:156 start_codon:yes stop_codon:yes gene_type:complete